MRRIQLHWPILTIAIGAVLARIWVAWSTHSTAEDFLITLRYADNLAGGFGFVYNRGEAVLGTTTPLYTLALAMFRSMGCDAMLWGKAINIGAEALTCYMIFRASTNAKHPRAGIAAALLYAGASASISISIGGMESALVTAAGMASIVAWQEKRQFALGIGCGILCLLRPDGAVLALLLLATFASGTSDRASKRAAWRQAGVAALVFGIILAPWCLYAWRTFGTPLPMSIIAKLQVYGRTRSGSLPNLHDFVATFASGKPQILLCMMALVGWIIAILRIPKLRVAAIWMAIYYAAMLTSRVPAFPWYFLPGFPVFYICCMVGLSQIVRRIQPVHQLLRGPAGPVTILAAALFLTAHLSSIRRDVAAAQQLEDFVRRPLGEWLRDNSSPDDRILLEPIGTIGYYSRLRVLDIIGLVSPEALPCYNKTEPHTLDCVTAVRRCEWLVLRDAEREQLTRLSEGKLRARGGDYRLMRVFSNIAGAPVFYVYRLERIAS